MGSERIHSWLKCCRLCLMDDGVKMPIFGEEGIHREVAKKIESCLPIVIYNSDPLSKLICQRCLFMLDTVYDFHQKCVQTSVVLTNQLMTIKNSSAVTVYLLTLEKNDLLAYSTSGKEPKKKHPTPDQIPIEDAFAVGRGSPSTSRELPQPDPLAGDNHTMQVKQEVMTGTKPVPQIVNVMGAYGGELRSKSSHDHAATLPSPESAGPASSSILALSEIKQEPGLTATQPSKPDKPFKRVTPWFCKFCNKYYKNKGTLYKHRKYFCSKQGFECHKCNRVFAVEKDKLIHLATHLRVYVNTPESKLVTCCHCEKRFLNKQMLENHLKTHRYTLNIPSVRKTSSESDISERDQPSPFQPQERVIPQAHFTSKSRYKCEYCPRSYTQKGKLNRHKSVHHRREMFPLLNPSFQRPRSVSPNTTNATSANVTAPTENETTEKNVEVLSLHRRMNRPAPLSKKKLSSTTLLRELLLKQQGPVPKCEQCNKLFDSRLGLSNHMRIHLPWRQKTLVQRCLDCGKMFGSKEGLRYHVNKFHGGGGNGGGRRQNKLQCKICNISFTSRTEWLMHKGSHSEAQKPGSDSSDQSSTNDDSRMSPHSIEKTIGAVNRKRPAIPIMPSCIYCDHEFDEVSELTTHLMTVHDLPRHFPCKICFKLFAHRSNMQRHLKIHQRHNQYASFPCNVCGKKFLSKETAEKHASTHSLSQTFHCPQCNKIFFKMEAFQNHYCSPGSQTEDSNDCPSCNFPYTKGHECQYREDGSRIVFIKNKVMKKKKKKPQHHSGRHYKCKYCIATFTSSYSHNSHMKIHTRRQGKDRVILSVPNVEQPVLTEIKAEPLDLLFDDTANEPASGNSGANNQSGENGFTWMHPENLIEVGRPTHHRGYSIQPEIPIAEAKKDQSQCSSMETVHNQSPNNSGLDTASVETRDMSEIVPVSSQSMVHVNVCKGVEKENSSALSSIKTALEDFQKTESTSVPCKNVQTEGVSVKETVGLSVCVKGILDIERSACHGEVDLQTVSKEIVATDSDEVGGGQSRATRSSEDSGETSLLNSYTSESVQEMECANKSSFDKSGFVRIDSMPAIETADQTRSLSVITKSSNTELLDVQSKDPVDTSSSVEPSPTSDSKRSDHPGRATIQCRSFAESSSAFGNYRGSSYMAHSGKEVYDCNMCSKVFPTPEELTTHVRWHSDPSKMAFKCPFCERGFVNSPAVYQHVLMNHKDHL